MQFAINENQLEASDAQFEHPTDTSVLKLFPDQQQVTQIPFEYQAAALPTRWPGLSGSST